MRISRFQDFIKCNSIRFLNYVYIYIYKYNHLIFKDRCMIYTYITIYFLYMCTRYYVFISFQFGMRGFLNGTYVESQPQSILTFIFQGAVKLQVVRLLVRPLALDFLFGWIGWEKKTWTKWGINRNLLELLTSYWISSRFDLHSLSLWKPTSCAISSSTWCRHELRLRHQNDSKQPPSVFNPFLWWFEFHQFSNQPLDCSFLQVSFLSTLANPVSLNGFNFQRQLWFRNQKHGVEVVRFLTLS